MQKFLLIEQSYIITIPTEKFHKNSGLSWLKRFVFEKACLEVEWSEDGGGLLLEFWSSKWIGLVETTGRLCLFKSLFEGLFWRKG